MKTLQAYLLAALFLLSLIVITGCTRTESPTGPRETPLDQGLVLHKSSGTTLVEDNFNTENGGIERLNYDGFANWNVTRGSVDLIGSFFDPFPGNGLYVDLDGSTFNAGRLESKITFTLDPGEYVLKFDLGGSTRGDVNTVVVALGGVFSEEFTLASNDPLTTITRNIPVSTPTSGNLSFDHSGSDNIGLILDNVKLTLEATVTICHKPGTSAQKTKVIPIEALAGHLGHGDRVGPCQ